MPKDDETANHVARRTRTNVYNERPTWLQLAHEVLDGSAFAAYGWQPTMSDDDILEKLLSLNLQRAKATK